MEKVIKLSVKDSMVEMPEDVSSCLKNLFSGCRVNFLLGAGFSSKLLGMLGNNEIVFEELRIFKAHNENEEKKATIISAYLYWLFFKKCIAPIADKVNIYSADFTPYKEFGNIVYRIFNERSNPVLDRQFNIFTTNYDPIIETIFNHSKCICNDGFEGRIRPLFSTDNYTKSYYRQAVFSNRKAEIPSLNLVKLHGSVTWAWDIIEGNLEYQLYNSAIQKFHEKYTPLFDAAIEETIEKHFSATTSSDAIKQIRAMVESNFLDTLIGRYKDFDSMLEAYKHAFLIVNPTKEKFSDTLLNKTYYELLRIFSNELEKENVLLIANGFSFRDEHIRDLIKRSMVNPSLKCLISCYEEEDIAKYERLIGETKNNNITYICLEGQELSLEYFNQILSCIHA